MSIKRSMKRVVLTAAMLALLLLPVTAYAAQQVPPGLDWLPEMGGVAFGIVLAALIEILKAIGIITENEAPAVTVVFAVVWAVAAVLGVFFPVIASGAVLVIKLIMTVAGVVGGALLSYKKMVQPFTRKRFNTYDKKWM